MKSVQNFLDIANETVPTLAAKEAIALHGSKAVFVDVRDSSHVAESGTIAGAHRIPRGFLEFAADEATPFHNPAMQKDADIYLICAAGGQAALSGKTLQEMGYQSVTNIGGIDDWKNAGGPMES